MLHRIEILGNTIKQIFVEILLVFSLVFGIFASILIMSGGDPQHDDHYFHFRYAQLLRTDWSRAVDHFDWIYLSGHGKEGGSRYAVNLYQISLIPFTYLPNEMMAMHMADAFYAALVVALVFAIMRAERWQYPLFFALSLMSVPVVAERLLLGRGFVLTIALVFVYVFLTLHRRYVWLFFVVVVHILWHQATYFLPVMIVGIVELSRMLILRSCDWKNILSVIGGTLTGMMFFPGFPQSLFAWLTQIMTIRATGIAATSGSLGGAEMAIDRSSHIMMYGIIILILCAMSVVIFRVYQQKRNVQKTHDLDDLLLWSISLSVLGFVLLCGALFFAGRVFDYVIPTLIVLGACLGTVLVRAGSVSVRTYTDVHIVFMMWVCLCVAGAYTLVHMFINTHTFDYASLQDAAQWIDAHSEDGSHVYLHNWGYFTPLFFANTHNVYSMGIEPTTLKWYDEALYWKYHNMFSYKYYCEKQGDCKDELYEELRIKRTSVEARNAFKKENSEKIIGSIKNDFDARIIFSNSEEFSGMIALSPELIDERYDARADDGAIQYTVFIVK